MFNAALEALTQTQLGVLVLEDLHWSDPSTVDVLSLLARRREEEQSVLAMASVAGVEFAVASVAAGGQMAPELPEKLCATLAQRGSFLEAGGRAVWPDGTVSGQYRFRRALYQQVLYRRLGAGRQARWHRVIGERLEQAYGARAHEIAAELALHFQRGQDAQRVVATGQTLAKSFCLVLLADVVRYAGPVEEELHLLAEAFMAFEASGRGDLLAEAYRLRGELLLCQGVPDMPQAEACFQQALVLARRQQAKSWELRTAMSLSRLWQCQGKRAAARALLEPIYDWFTEGFETADLQEARALLETLA